MAHSGGMNDTSSSGQVPLCGSRSAGEAESKAPVQVKTPKVPETSELSKPVTTRETESDLPIGEAQPEGEHVRSLRVFSTGGDTRDSCGRKAAINRTDDSSRSVREVQILRVFRDPDIMIAPNLITKAQCLHLLQLADGKWTRSKTSIGMATASQADYTTVESKTRTSKSVILKEAQTPCVTSVELLASALAQMPIQHLESLVLVRYDEGEYFNEHHDGAFRPKTVLLYLNDVEDGGFTHFTRLGLQIAPSEGCGAVWRNVTPQGSMDCRLLHAGVPPKRGTKYVVNCFFNASVVRFAQPAYPLPAAENEKDCAAPPLTTREFRNLPNAHQIHQMSENQFRLQPRCVTPNSRAGTLHSEWWCPPTSRRSSQQQIWGQAMMQMLQQFRPQERINPATPLFLSGMPKYIPSPVGVPAGLACPADAWRGLAAPGGAPGCRWLHNWPPTTL